MRFLFLGAGAIGTYLGGSLSIAGHDVSYVEQPGVADVIRGRGLILHRGGYTRTQRDVTLYTDNADALAAGPYDACVFALKSFDTLPALDALVATGLAVPPVLTLQNGVDNEPVIAARLGVGHVISGTVTSAIGKPGVGEVVEEKHRGVGIATGGVHELGSGSLDALGADHLEPPAHADGVEDPHPLALRLVTAFDSAGLTTRAYPHAGPMKWSKLLTNLVGNATSAILDLPVRDLFADKRLSVVELAVLRECLDVMQALGHDPVDLPGTPVRLLSLAPRVPTTLVRPILVKLLGGARGDKMPSFHIDLYSGRGRSEVQWLNGAVVRHGEHLGVPTPVNRVLTETLQGLTDGTIPLERFRHRPDALLALLP